MTRSTPRQWVTGAQVLLIQHHGTNAMGLFPLCEYPGARVPRRPAWSNLGVIERPVHGADGNVEYLIAVQKT